MKSDGKVVWRVEAPTLLEQSHLRIVTIAGIEVQMQSMVFRAIEFDAARRGSAVGDAQVNLDVAAVVCAESRIAPDGEFGPGDREERPRGANGENGRIRAAADHRVRRDRDGVVDRRGIARAGRACP